MHTYPACFSSHPPGPRVKPHGCPCGIQFPYHQATGLAQNYVTFRHLLFLGLIANIIALECFFLFICLFLESKRDRQRERPPPQCPHYNPSPAFPASQDHKHKDTPSIYKSAGKLNLPIFHVDPALLSCALPLHYHTWPLNALLLNEILLE